MRDLQRKWIFLFGACIYFIWGISLLFIQSSQFPERSLITQIYMSNPYIMSCVFILTSITVFIEIFRPMRYSIWGIVVQQFLLLVFSLSRILMVIDSQNPLAVFAFHMPSMGIAFIHICAIIGYYGKNR